MMPMLPFSNESAVKETAEVLAQKLAEFTPKIAADDWAVIRPFVLAAVRDAAAHVTYAACDLVSICAAHVQWTWRNAGHPLDRSIVFNPYVIEESIEARGGGYAPGTVSNWRSELIGMGRALLPNELSLVKLTSLYKSSPVAPYSKAELNELCSWADGQRTRNRRHDAAVMLHAGAGAGLKDRELRDLRTGDVVIDSDGVLLFVRGERERAVPVLERWEQQFTEFVDFIGDPERYLFRPNVRRNGQLVTGNFAARTNGTNVWPTLQRLRATWIVHHLAARTPVRALMLAAGVTSLETVRRYVQFVPDLEADEYRQMLREARS